MMLSGGLKKTSSSGPAAPVVDSTLLRFISQQKEIQDVFAVNDNANDANNINKNNAGVEDPTGDSEFMYERKMVATARVANQIRKKRPTLAQQPLTAQLRFTATSVRKQIDAIRTADVNNSNYKQNRNTNQSNNNSYNLEGVGGNNNSKNKSQNKKKKDDEEEWVVTNTLSNTDPSTSFPSSSSSQAASSSSWMVQFSSKNVQHALLSSAGKERPDLAVAQVAGDAVERYCTVRTARRRIRQFLKERDTVWSSSSSSSTTSDESHRSRQELETLAAFETAWSPAAPLLLSYMEQKEQQQEKRETRDGNVHVNEDYDQEDLDGDHAMTSYHPDYNFQEVIDVMKGYGLTSNDVCVLLTHSPSLALRIPRQTKIPSGIVHAVHAVSKNDYDHAGESLEETLERSFQCLLQTTLKLRRYDARKVLRSCPNLLSVRGSKSAVNVVKMMTMTGVSASSLARDKGGLPTLLSRSPASLFRLISFLSSTYVRMPVNQIGPLLRRKVGQNLLNAVNPVPLPVPPSAAATATTSTEEAGEGEAEYTAPTHTRETLNRDRAERKAEIERTYGRMVQTSHILQQQIETKDLTKVISAYPEILLLDAEKDILPVARYLMGGLGIWSDDLSSLLQMYPTVMGKDILELEKVVSYLVDDLSVDEGDLGKIFRSFPMLFNVDVDTQMVPVVQYLNSTCGIEDIGNFVTKLPAVLGYTVEEIAPKWEFLKKITFQPEYELNKFPAFVSYPFHRVIKTRFNYLAHKNIFWLFSSNRIDQVLRYGDVDFATKIARDEDYGKSYKAFGLQYGIEGSKDLIGTKPWRTTRKRRRRRNKTMNTNNLRFDVKNRNYQASPEASQLPQSPRQEHSKNNIIKDRNKTVTTPDDVIRSLNTVFKQELSRKSSQITDVYQNNKLITKRVATPPVNAVTKNTASNKKSTSSPLFSKKQQQQRQQSDDDTDGLIGSISPSPA